MPEQDPHEPVIIGTVVVNIDMDDEGFGVRYTHDGLSLPSAIGYLTVVLDRMRALEAKRWPKPSRIDEDED